MEYLAGTVTKELAAGTQAILDCHSNDYDHNFLFWILGHSNQIIGPGNIFDERKYKYEVLSGKLHIANVLPDESGSYLCVSKKLSGSGISVGDVEMIVKGSAFSPIEAVKLVAIVMSIIVIISSVVIYFRMKKEWNKYDGRIIVAVDDTEDVEDDNEEIYNRTTTTLPQAPVPGPSRNQSSEHLLYGIDNQGLDTDFNSVFENIQIKSPAPNTSLI